MKSDSIVSFKSTPNTHVQVPKEVSREVPLTEEELIQQRPKW